MLSLYYLIILISNLCIVFRVFFVIIYVILCYEPAHKKREKIDQQLQNQPLRGGNLLYITQMNNY